MVIVEHLASMRKQGLDMFPYPLSAIPNHTKPHRVFGNHARLFDLLQGLAQVVVCLHLMPTQDMHDAIAVEQVEAKSLGFAPLVAPLCPSRSLACLAWTAPPSALRAFGDSYVPQVTSL
jgi:hypothetical protein